VVFWSWFTRQEAGRPDAATASIPAPGDLLGGLGSQLIEYVAARVAPHERIHEVAFIDAIPTSPSGKTLRRLLAASDREPG
jgi:acyl-coenzyme A synthetase/AMP-(fatty) acid ligase